MSRVSPLGYFALLHDVHALLISNGRSAFFP
jgi:hypothetical protein